MKTLSLAALMGALVAAAYEDDRVLVLPDAMEFDTPTYSGYVDAAETRHLHYVFVESYDAPTTDPLVVWFNGGPGCSSMLGFMQEHGPRVIDDGEMYIKNNLYPWAARANVLYIESPAGVGFSVADTEQDLKTNDKITAEDSLQALKNWFVKFPEFKTNQLFISGESYGGIYVPWLAWEIYQNNQEAEFNPSIDVMNIEGFIVGNGATNWDYDVQPSFPATAYYFNLIPKYLLDTYNENGC